jgi:hypothetical protein
MSSGGGGGGKTEFEWNDDMKPYWRSLLGRAQSESASPYSQYGGERIAGLNADQTAAMGNIRHFVGDPGSFLYGQGNKQYQDTLSGKYLEGDGANPFSRENKYGGINPMFQSQLKSGMDDITAQYMKATAPDTQAQAVLNGTFGGGDHQRVIANNHDALAKNLSRYTDDAISKQIDRSAGLEDSFLARSSGNYEAERQRQMMAGQASQADQGLTLQRYQALAGVGDINQQHQQRYLDQGYQNWFDYMNHGKNQSAWMANVLTGAQGGLAPNQTTSPAGGGWSGASNTLGTALAAYGMFRG